MNPTQLRAQTPDRRRELVARHLPPKRPEEGFEAFVPIEADGEDVHALFELHTLACLGKKGESEAKKILEASGVQVGLQSALESVGAYNRKSPNASVGAGPLFALPPGEDRDLPPGASSRTAPCVRRIGSAGNAAYAAYMSFLAKEYVVDGVVRSVAEDFAARGPLWQAAIEAGLPADFAETVAERLRARVERSEIAPIDRFLKQIYWPTADGDYCLLSPVQSFAALGELVLRLDRIVRKERHIVSREYAKVAGANAINAGQLNAEIGGLQPHLLCLPPKRRAPLGFGDYDEDWLAAKLAELTQFGTVFFRRSIGRETAEAIRSFLEDARRAAPAQRRLEAFLRYAAEEAIEEAAIMGECLQAENFPRLSEEGFEATPIALKIWLDPRNVDLPQNRSADREIFGELAEHVYARVFEPWLNACPAGAEFRLALLSAIRRAL